jgi:hypothetical protein
MWLMTASDEPRSPSKRLPRPERQAAFRVGISAESRAAAFLIAKGLSNSGAALAQPGR